MRVMKTPHILDSLARLEQAAAEADISMAAICREAGVHQSTITRWKAAKTDPLRKLRALEAAFLVLRRQQ